MSIWIVLGFLGVVLLFMVGIYFGNKEGAKMEREMREAADELVRAFQLERAKAKKAVDELKKRL